MAGVYSVEQINRYIKNMFSSDFVLNRLRVKGEVSNCKYHTSGHIYFTLKDSDNTLSAVMFANSRTGLKFKLADGMQVVVTGSISIYENAGKYQLYAKSIEQQGNGELYERFLMLKNELQDMGMFDEMYKKSIPSNIHKLGIVTASTGAAVQDIINISKRRNPYIQLILYPAIVQGKMAAESICSGIKMLDKLGVDVIIAGRGGGSIEDLWAFNEEIVAKAIFECNTPIISAVGHETDFTIADFVSDLRAPTPSAAAELAVNDISDVMRTIDAYNDRINRLINDKIFYLRRRCEDYSTRLKLMSPGSVLNIRRQKLDEIYDNMEIRMNNILTSKKNKLSVLSSRLNGLSPLARLNSGYSYTEDEEHHAVTSIHDVAVGSRVQINVSDGKIYTEVLNLEEVKRV